jgi:hypothetical protein
LFWQKKSGTVTMAPLPTIKAIFNKLAGSLPYRMFQILGCNEKITGTISIKVPVKKTLKHQSNVPVPVYQKHFAARNAALKDRIRLAIFRRKIS